MGKMEINPVEKLARLGGTTATDRTMPSLHDITESDDEMDPGLSNIVRRFLSAHEQYECKWSSFSNSHLNLHWFQFVGKSFGCVDIDIECENISIHRIQVTKNVFVLVYTQPLSGSEIYQNKTWQFS